MIIPCCFCCLFPSGAAAAEYELVTFVLMEMRHPAASDQVVSCNVMVSVRGCDRVVLCCSESLVDVREAVIHVSQIQLEGRSRPFPAVTPRWVPSTLLSCPEQHQHLRVGEVKHTASYCFIPCRQCYQSVCLQCVRVHDCVCSGAFDLL